MTTSKVPWAKKAIELRETGLTYQQIVDSIKADGVEYKGLRGKDQITRPNLSRFFKGIGMGKYSRKRRRKNRTAYINGHSKTETTFPATEALSFIRTMCEQSLPESLVLECIKTYISNRESRA